MTKPRKPRRPDNLTVRECLHCVTDAAYVRVAMHSMIVSVDLDLAHVRRLHDWLGRYIAWREAKDAD